MSSPGWYPDPSGQPNSFRYWDGQAWSQQTTDNPYVPPPSAWQQQPQRQPPQPQQGYGDAAGGYAPEQAQPTPTTPEQPVQPEPAAGQPQAWGAEQHGAAEPQDPQQGQPWGQQPQQPQQPQQWGEQPEEPTQWGATAPAAGAGAAAGGWQDSGQQGSGQQAWGDHGNQGQQWGDSTQQFAATPAAGGGGGHWSGDGQWSPMPGDGGKGGGSKKALWIVLAGVLVILLIVAGIFGAMALLGDDDDDDKKADDAQSSQVSESPSESPSESTSPSESPSETPSETASETPSTGTDDIPPEPVPDFCISGDPMNRATYPEDGNLYGGGLSLAPVKGFELPPGSLADVYRFADDVATYYREIEQGWVSVLALGGLEKKDAGSDMEKAATAVTNCMAESPNFYRDLQGVDEIASEALTVDGRDAWRVQTEIRIKSPDVQAEGDVAEVVIVDLGDDTYGMFAGVVPLGDKQLSKRLEEAVGNLTVS